MDKVTEYTRRADECLKHAKAAETLDVRTHYEELAEMWLKMAEDRLKYFADKRPPPQSASP